MCDTCGCGDPEVVPIEIRQNILADNDHRAEHNREHFVAHGVLAINVMGSPGSGKTAVLEATAKTLGGARRVLAVSGDLATDNDAARLRAAGIESRAITTGTACHLDARLVHDALHQLEWKQA
jgi:hydrogenase nickel incorporation protein HypB